LTKPTAIRSAVDGLEARPRGTGKHPCHHPMIGELVRQKMAADPQAWLAARSTAGGRRSSGVHPLSPRTLVRGYERGAHGSVVGWPLTGTTPP
jgi:hypothetical protein